MATIFILILSALTVISVVVWLIQMFKVKVWICTKSKREARMSCIGFMKDNGSQEVPEVLLASRSNGPAIGRIKMGDTDDNAYVEILSSDGNDETAKAQYRTCGYVAQDGYIYRQLGKNKRPEKVGYTARPSAPKVPIAVGERTWHSLWLKCQLNAYMGEPSESGKAKMPVSQCYHYSFHSSKNDAMPPETRSAAFGLLFGLYNKNDYREYYNSPAYGWKDTALLATLIYTLGYVLWYFIRVKIMGKTLLNSEPLMPFVLYAVYFGLWAIVRAIKIECIENSNTIQPKIDLFNKALGQRFFDYAILACCLITLLFSLGEGAVYGLDFMALIAVIITGVIINMIMKSSSARWEVKNPFAVDDDSDMEDEEIVNPEGDIARLYKWTLDAESNKNVSGELTLYYTSQYISDLRFVNPFYNQRKDKPLKLLIMDMFHYMKEHRGITARLRYVATQIQRISAQNGLDDFETLQFTIDFVQEPNIRFCLNRDSKAINQFEDYIRYPDEVLYDKEADSNSKALLAAMLFHFMQHNVLYLFSRVQHHGAIGIEVKKEWIEDNMINGHGIDEISFVYNNRRYIFCETTSDGFRIGGTMGGMKYDDFDEQIEFTLIEDDVDDSNEESVTCLYNWDLDSPLGNQLHGSYTLEFSKTEIDDLRANNPFLTYATDHSSYEDNIRKIFDFINQSSERQAKVSEIAQYIRTTIKDANLGSYDLVQFALDFCQAPNITYCVDEQSAGISFAQEYMRFPDEVLFDKEGDCDCKSSLTAALFHALGYKVLVMLSRKLQHAAIGVEANDEWLEHIDPAKLNSVLREYNGTKYLYCETTGDGFRVGQIKDEDSIHDFDTIVEINA